MSVTRFRISTSVLSLVAAAAMLPGAAFAQSAALETDEAAASSGGEIIVTAQRRAERSVDVPITVATLGSEQLTTANVRELSDITKLTPGLRFDNAGAFFQPTIRGIGTAVTTSGGGGNVGIYIDGFYSPNPLATNSQLLNVQSIQVLKGPQGTLFGRNTTGGAILIQSLEPSTETSAQFKASYGRYNEWKTQGYATFGLGDNVAVDFEGLYSKGDGWRRDVTNGNRRVGDYKNWQVRVGAKVDLSDDVSFLLRFQHGDINDPNPLLAASYRDNQIGSGAPFGGIPGTFTYAKNRIASGSVPEFFRSKSNVIQGTLKADLGFADLTSYTQYRKEDVNASQDLDYSGVNIFQLGLPNRNRTFSQEILLNSKPGGPLQWTAGLFYFSNKDIYITYIDNAGSAPGQRIRLGGSGTTTKSYAAFVDATYELTPQLFLTAGVRYAEDKVVDGYWNTRFLAPTYVRNGAAVAAPGGVVPVPSISDNRITPRFVVRYKPNDQSSIYASYTKGYKAAIVDVGGTCQNPPYVCNSVKPETIDAFEVGFKYDDSKLSFEASGFYYDYKNLQVSIFRSGTAELVNAAKSKIYGLDGQLRYRFSDSFEVNLGAAWTHARYETFGRTLPSGEVQGAPIYTRCPAPVVAKYAAACSAGETFYVNTDTILRNATMQRTPEFTGNIGARYSTDLAEGELTLSGNLSYSSKFYFGPSGIQFPQKGFETLSLRAQWTDPSDTFMIAAYGDNVTNSRYLTQVQYASFGLGANWSKPVTYGVEVGVKF